MTFYAKNELVWAKIKGYPWWPGVIAKSWEKSENNKKEILVNFIGENSHASLNETKVAKFQEKFEEYSTAKNKKLKESIDVALKIQSKEISYEEERKRLERIDAALRKQKINQVPEKTDEVKKRRKEKSGLGRTGLEDDKLSFSSRNESTTSKTKEMFFESPRSPNKGKPGAANGKEGYSWQRSQDSEEDKSESSKDEEIGEKKVNEAYIKAKMAAKQGKRGQESKKGKNGRKRDSSEDESPKRTPFKIIRENNNEREYKKGRNNLKKRKSSSEESNEKYYGEHDNSIIKPRKTKGKLVLDESDTNDQENVSQDKSGSGNQHKESILSQTHSSVEGDFKEKLDLLKSSSGEHGKEGSKQVNIGEFSEEIHEEEEEMRIEKRGNEQKGNKRPNPSVVFGLNSPKHIAIIPLCDIKEVIRGNEDGHEMIFKKVKEDVKPEKESSHSQDIINGFMYANTFNTENEVDEMEIENSLANQKLEKDLEQIIEVLSKRLKAGEKLKDPDLDITKLIERIEEFEGHNLNGFELIRSNFGKIFKTLHHMLIRKKLLLNKAGGLLILAVAKIVHKIKSKIIQSCFDNTEYLRSFHLEEEAMENGGLQMAVEVDIHEIKLKMEEINMEEKLKQEKREQARMKVEEEVCKISPKLNPKPVEKLIDERPIPEPTQEVVVKSLVEENRATWLALIPNDVEFEQEQLNVNEEKETNKVNEANKAMEITNDNLKPLNNEEVENIQEENTKLNETVNEEKNQNTQQKEDRQRMETRIKVCQKITKLLQKSFALEKARAQQIALNLENKMNEYYIGNVNEYTQSLKDFHRLVRKNLRVEELENFVKMEIGDFIRTLKA